MSKADDLVLLAFKSPRSPRRGEDIVHTEAVTNRALELGIPKHHTEYYWIAEESLKADLPQNWLLCYTDEGIFMKNRKIIR